jgi:hypothetical protein
LAYCEFGNVVYVLFRNTYKLASAALMKINSVITAIGMFGAKEPKKDM